MEDLVKQILIEVRNLSYLFFAFGIIWLLLFLYMYSLSRRGREMQREIDELKRMHTDDHDDD
jgi:CcmD family protein